MSMGFGENLAMNPEGTVAFRLSLSFVAHAKITVALSP